MCGSVCFGDTVEEVAAHFVTFVEEQNADFRENICMVIAKWQRWKLSMAWKNLLGGVNAILVYLKPL